MKVGEVRRRARREANKGDVVAVVVVVAVGLALAAVYVPFEGDVGDATPPPNPSPLPLPCANKGLLPDTVMGDDSDSDAAVGESPPTGMPGISKPTCCCCCCCCCGEVAVMVEPPPSLLKPGLLGPSLLVLYLLSPPSRVVTVLEKVEGRRGLAVDDPDADAEDSGPRD